MPKFYEFLCFIIDFFYRRLLNSRCLAFPVGEGGPTKLVDEVSFGRKRRFSTTSACSSRWIDKCRMQ